MKPTTFMTEGTVQADGTLVLHEKPILPAGPVQVELRPIPVSAEPREDILGVLHRIRADQKSKRHIPRSREEIDADIAAMRDEDEARMEAIERLHEESQRNRPDQSTAANS